MEARGRFSHQYLQRRDYVASTNVIIMGLYFSASWCGSCQHFTPKLAESYNKLRQNGKFKFEVVFISGDEDNDAFSSSFSKMPWLAVPFKDSVIREQVCESFSLVPYLVIIDENGKVLIDEGVEIVQEYGSEGYPFDPEHIQKLKQEAKRSNQLLE